MTDLAKLTWPEARERFGPDLVCILPCGATEPHGPHLPLDTDVTIAQAQARRAAEVLEERGVATLVLPPVNYGLTHFTEGFEGRITLRPGTLWALLEDVVESLEEQGVRRVVFVNAHLEPANVKILRGVAADYSGASEHDAAGKPRSERAHRAEVVFADNTRRRWAGTLGEEFQSGDCHAGRYESSIVLASDPDSVREDKRLKLPELEIGLIEKMQAGAQSFIQAGATDAYCGDPAAATAAEGRELIDALARMTVTSIEETWPDLFR